MNNEMTPTRQQEELERRIRGVVDEYLRHDDDYEGDVQLAINPSDLTLEIADPDDDLPELDYFPMMDLICINSGDPLRWEPDDEAIAEVAAQYIFAR